MEIITKICTSCNTKKEISQFSNLKISKDGKNCYCKECTREKNKQFRLRNLEKIKIKKQQDYQNNKEKILKKRKEYYEENRDAVLNRVSAYTEINREEINQKRRQFRKDNLEHLKQKDREKYEKFREKILEDRKRYFRENRESIKQRQKRWYKTENGIMLKRNANMKRRAKYKQGDVTTDQLKELYQTTKRCYWCNCKLIKGKIHTDHYIPLANGGLHTISNLVLACRDCNLSKGSTDPLEFANKLGKLL